MTIEQAKNILKLTGETKLEDIRRAYRKMAMQYHPDRYRTYQQQAWATYHFIKIKEACDFLMASKAVLNENVYKKEEPSFQEEDSYQSNAEPEQAWQNYAEIGKPRTLFDWIIDKITDTKNNILLEIIIGTLTIIPLLVFMYYNMVVVFLENISKKMGISASPNSISKKERFAFLAINSTAAFLFLPILYSMVFADHTPTMPRIIFGLISSAVVVLFILSEWISFFFTSIWRRSINVDLAMLFPAIRK